MYAHKFGCNVGEREREREGGIILYMFQDYSIRCKELEREVKAAIVDRDNAAMQLKVGDSRTRIFFRIL